MGVNSKLVNLSRDCMFSGELADDNEHVIPKWLQRRFNLYGQEVILPNQTAFRYAKAKVAVKGEHNRTFGRIENRMAEGRFSLQEAYLWALKIHIGMMWLDSRLKWERRDASSSTILDRSHFANELVMFRHLYKNWANGGTTLPYPFGSVFVLEGALMPGEFDFVHCMISGTVGISIGDDLFLVVLLWDRAEGMRGPALRDWYSEFRPRIQNSSAEELPQASYMARHVWTCELAHELLLWRRRFSFREQHNLFVATPTVSMRARGPVDWGRFLQSCRAFALKPISTQDEIPCRYIQEVPGQKRNDSK